MPLLTFPPVWPVFLLLPPSRQAKSTENDLSHGLPPDAAGTRAGTSEILQSQPQQGVQSTSNASTELSANTPAPPYILSRSHNSIELLPTPFLVPSTTKLENDYTRSGGGGRGLSLASNATSTNQSQATTGSVQKPGKALVRRVAKVRLEGINIPFLRSGSPSLGIAVLMIGLM